MTHRAAAIDPSERREVSKALKAAIGFDPFRVLDNDLPGDQDAVFQFRSMVGGMHRLAVVRGWKAAERRLGRGPDGGPREAVIRRLEQREEWLEERGELEERLTEERRDDRDIPKKEFFWIGKDGERIPEAERPTSATQKLRNRSIGGNQSVATDGGSP